MLKNKAMNFDFVNNLKKFIIVSCALLLVGLVVSIVFGPVLDISFKGGTRISYSYTGELNVSKVESVAEKAINKKVSVTTSSGVSDSSKKFSIALSEDTALETKSIDKLTKTLVKDFEKNKIVQAEVESVNPSVGTIFFIKCLVAVTIAAILVIAYVAWRFRKIGGFSAGVTALIALIHDVLIAFFAAVVLRLNIDANFIAVVMTLLGYSLNSTIVVFDRVRENRRVYGAKKPVDELVNISNNQVFTRNIMTTLSTLIAIFVVFIVCELNGITSLRTLTIPLMFGLLSGSYSSICIAPTLWVKWKQFKAKKENNN